MAVQPIGALASGALQAPGASGAAAADGFAASLGRLVTGTEAASGQANEAVGRMLDGSGDVHDAMIALQRADLSLQLTVQIRNKLVSAYQEIMRMPI
jgi:flagellar hook-basal body complex protein FliE